MFAGKYISWKKKRRGVGGNQWSTGAHLFPLCAVTSSRRTRHRRDRLPIPPSTVLSDVKTCQLIPVVTSRQRNVSKGQAVSIKLRKIVSYFFRIFEYCSFKVWETFGSRAVKHCNILCNLQGTVKKFDYLIFTNLWVLLITSVTFILHSWIPVPRWNKKR